MVENQPTSSRTRRALRSSAWTPRHIAAASSPTPTSTPPTSSSPWPPSTSATSAAATGASPTAPPPCGSWPITSPPVPPPCATRVAELGLADVDPADQGDVDDPAGGDDEVYIDCALQLSVLIDALASRLA